MRSVYQTIESVVVNDRNDRTNVVLALRVVLQRLRFCLHALRHASLREAWTGNALAQAKRITHPGLGTMLLVPAGSSSWGGHSLSGGSGKPSRS